MDNTRASSATITGIFRYPVKGLTPEPLPRADLKVGETLRSDRRYAIENGPSGFDPSAPTWLAKPHFLMLQRDEWLAPLRAHFDDDSHVLTLRRDGAMVAQGDLETEAGRAAIERYFADRHAGQIKGPPKVLVSPGHSFSDVPRTGGLDHQPGEPAGDRGDGAGAGASAALSRQPLCRGLAGLA